MGCAILVPARAFLVAPGLLLAPLPMRRTGQCGFDVFGTSCLQVGVVLVGEGHVGGSLHLLLVGLHGGLVDLDLRGSESGGGNELL